MKDTLQQLLELYVQCTGKRWLRLLWYRFADQLLYSIDSSPAHIFLKHYTRIIIYTRCNQFQLIKMHHLCV